METEVRVNVEREKVSQRNQNMGKEVLLIFMHIIMMQELLSILQKIDVAVAVRSLNICE